jgi:prepilin peptidase CpaA
MTTANGIALLLSLVGCITDLRTRRIPNVLTFGGAAGGLAFHLARGGAGGFLYAAEGWMVGVVVFFLPFALGGMGGGDIKLLAALGAWLGPSQAFWLAMYTGVAGGVLALMVAWVRGYLRQALANLRLLLTHWRVAGVTPLKEVTLAGSKAPKLAYAVPIFVGTVITLWLQR